MLRQLAPQAWLAVPPLGCAGKAIKGRIQEEKEVGIVRDEKFYTKPLDFESR